MGGSQVKVAWEGEVVGVQPRSTVWRYMLDNRTHRECGYNLFVKGTAHVDGEPGIPAETTGRGGRAYDFCVALSEKQQVKLGFRVGDTARGTAWTPLHPECEFADFYRAGACRVAARGADGAEGRATAVTEDRGDCRCDGTPIPRVSSADYPGPPWRMAAPPLEVYAWRGARMFSKSSWKAGCLSCVWANMANVTMQYDFDRGIVKNRFEAFCYGPLSCRRYKPGPVRSVSYKGRGTDKDTGWLDGICTEYRADPDE